MRIPLIPDPGLQSLSPTRWVLTTNAKSLGRVSRPNHPLSLALTAESGLSASDCFTNFGGRSSYSCQLQSASFWRRPHRLDSTPPSRWVITIRVLFRDSSGRDERYTKRHKNGSSQEVLCPRRIFTARSISGRKSCQVSIYLTVPQSDLVTLSEYCFCCQQYEAFIPPQCSSTIGSFPKNIGSNRMLACSPLQPCSGV